MWIVEEELESEQPEQLPNTQSIVVAPSTQHTQNVPMQFAAPFTMDANGQVVTVDQDSEADIASCVYNIVICPPGAKLNDPDFGAPSLLFQSLPFDLEAIRQAIMRLEPRAINVSAQDITNLLAGGTPADRSVQITVGVD